MKAIIPVTSDKYNAPVSIYFARSKYFAFIDTIRPVFEIIENPFPDKKNGLGKALFDYISMKFEPDTLIAFELGLNVQQMAGKKKMQLILLNDKNNTLRLIFEMLKINPEQCK